MTPSRKGSSSPTDNLDSLTGRRPILCIYRVIDQSYRVLIRRRGAHSEISGSGRGIGSWWTWLSKQEWVRLPIQRFKPRRKFGQITTLSDDPCVIQHTNTAGFPVG